MDPSASLSSLPPELSSKIYHDPGLGQEDLVNLRLTSRIGRVHASATKALAKLCFTEVSLALTKHSLESLVEICQHPVFGPNIRKVQLSCVHVDREDSQSSLNCTATQLDYLYINIIDMTASQRRVGYDGPKAIRSGLEKVLQASLDFPQWIDKE
ncbi:hypothetical protein QM012_008633 [Aureobasidium pullulans]|uniref:F-box domain-containing protein n=1 Tax=Aureobasidium pullulans TaxID=5580 RepID=A0ABR0TJY6_AURPU